MRIINAKFLISVSDSRKLPDYGAPEIAFAGKSNAGKSSFINFLTGYSKIAKVSNTPGRTRLINYFSVNNGALIFVDLPGYGFAKASKDEQAKWGALAEGYLGGSKNLRNVFVLMDIRHNPSDDDKMLLNYLYAKSIPFTIIATKSDKLSRSQTVKRMSEIAENLGIGVMNVYPISSLKTTGK